ncbi:class I adenylate-forming enzyme family protein [Streptomyces sp. NPDC001255]|uniref:class I adenylate-forming enzyme family protein n=1 Tax=Streptomyces sp. NPDC001255 TaxID=3364550 RepID=UPI0036B071B1
MTEHTASGQPPVLPPLRGRFSSLGDALAAAARQFGAREAYVDGGERIGFDAWHQQADSVAAEFAAWGLRRGDVLALMLPSGIAYAVAYAAAVRLGAVVTGLNTRLGPHETLAVLDRCRPALVVRDENAGLPEVPAGPRLMTRATLESARYTGGRPRAFERVGPEDPAVIIWSSGTTGTPKGAWYDHRGLEAAVHTAGVMSAPFDRKLVATPFAHAGYMAKVWDQLAWGTTLVVGGAPWRAAEMARTIAEERITVVGGVPTQWAKLLELPDTGGAPWPHVRVGISATAPAPPELVRRVRDLLGVPLVVRYAMTESPSISGTDPQDSPETQFRTVGRPQQGVEVRVVDGAERTLPEGETGAVRVRGAGVMRGYWRDPDRTRSALDVDGWLHTGDVGRFTPEGTLVLTGRSSDLYIRGGYNVHPLEVENVLSEHPLVGRVAVVGAPAPVIGEIGVAFVVPADADRPPSLEALREFTRAHLADYKAPDRVVVLAALPLTPMLKVDRRALRVLATTG